MIESILTISLILFGVAILITFIRIVIGPTFPDRVIAMDVIGVNLISAMAIVSVLFSTRAFYDVILVLGILAFISTISFSKFLERGAIIERKRDI
ncbi:Na(+)/H(+) antiporter subunit F1 [Pseudogracilibacillus auburnensis]|uniref:Multisubunit sodium/proton antiporter MrpF subunit n=1 Tax=Pseudogracilibacillus auburnensis TaxID=1494959 RepID=A0A2V3W0U6_9BACI|nr:Na(+)/H(+) antiporter subunit F1 [Pseudogracilibacillus auburnensis]MBO1002203.1 Na(+)/H(+) antiporter subunit F1 [Pseudogracilibacillus auburnensis]PXW87530.1 multisubunit sodium/proton antiporter MrpF subunit [Pseudogracilibacillus auburnensis]